MHVHARRIKQADSCVVSIYSTHATLPCSLHERGNIYERENFQSNYLFNDVFTTYDFVVSANVRPGQGLYFAPKERHYFFLLRVISRTSYASLLASLKSSGLVLARQREHCSGGVVQYCPCESDGLRLSRA